MSNQYPGGLITKNPVVPSGPYETSTASGIWTLDQQAYYRKLNQWPTAGNPVPDAEFNYVTMLLHGDGTNGAQNNTFLDSSTNAFTITRNGNTTQGSFSPYGDNWGNYFAANSSSYITAPNSSSFSFTGDFTVECWLFVPSISQTIQRIFSSNAGPAGACFFSVGNNAGTNAGAGRLCAMGQLTSPYNIGLISSTSAIPTSTWVHAALVRSGSTVTIYQDGVSVATGTNSSTWDFNNGAGVRISGTPWDSNEYLNGYVSNLRVVKGTAVYTSTFTPSTTPLTAITNTVLLTCQSNRFKDNSSSPFTLTPAGDTSVQRFNPFGTSTAYDTSVIGGSGYFDGSGDSLTVAASSAFAFGSGDFSVQFWVYFTAATGDNQTAVELKPMRLIIGRKTNNKARIYVPNTDQNNGNNGPDIPNNAWTHFSVARTGTTMYVYINGVSAFSFSSTDNFTSNPSISIGRNDDLAEPMIGYLSDVRILKGTYNVTLPTAPYTAITNTSLLTNFTNGAIFDNAMMNDLETVGNAQISTSVYKYGTGSLAFDGTGDYLISRDYLSFTFGTGDFTIEMWLYYSSSASGSDFVIDCRPTSVNGAYPTIYIDSGIVYYYVNTANRITSSAISTNTWMHIALCRSGTSTKMFINGTQTGSTYTDSTNYICRTDGPVIGADRNFGDSLLGYLDDLRITKGYARYTANFTAPTAAFPNTGPY